MGLSHSLHLSALPCSALGLAPRLTSIAFALAAIACNPSYELTVVNDSSAPVSVWVDYVDDAKDLKKDVKILADERFAGKKPDEALLAGESSQHELPSDEGVVVMFGTCATCISLVSPETECHYVVQGYATLSGSGHIDNKSDVTFHYDGDTVTIAD